MKTELIKFEGVLSPDYTECVEEHKSDEEVEDGGEGEQRTLLKITLHFLRRMK